MKRLLFVLFFLLLASSANAQTCTRVSSTAQNCVFNLSWSAPATDATHDAATSYQVQRKDGAGSFATVATVTTLTYTQTLFNDPGNATYCYQVISANAAGPDGPSNSVCKTTPAIPALIPNPPSNLTVSALSNSQIRLTWRDNSDNELGFQVQRNGAIVNEYAMNTVTAIDSGLTPRTWYTYKVRAINDAGSSAWSNASKTKTGK